MKNQQIILIQKGKPPSVATFIHLPHGADVRCDQQAIDSDRQLAHLKKYGNLIIRKSMYGSIYERIVREIFLSALRYIRQDLKGARLRGEYDPLYDSRNF